MVCSTCERKLSKVKPPPPLPRKFLIVPARTSLLMLGSLVLVVNLSRLILILSAALAVGLQVIVQDKWKDGARNTMESGGRKIGENKLLSKKKRCLLPPLPSEGTRYL